METKLLWRFLDDKAEIQGPFSNEHMKEWFAGGYFSNDTLVSFSSLNSPFIALKHWYPTMDDSANPFEQDPLVTQVLCRDAEYRIHGPFSLLQVFSWMQESISDSDLELAQLDSEETDPWVRVDDFCRNIWDNATSHMLKEAFLSSNLLSLLLHDATDEDIFRIAKQVVSVESYQAGDQVFKKGESGEHFFIIESGEFEVIDQGIESCISQSGIIGEICLLHPFPTKRRVSAKCIAPGRLFKYCGYSIHIELVSQRKQTVGNLSPAKSSDTEEVEVVDLEESETVNENETIINEDFNLHCQMQEMIPKSIQLGKRRHPFLISNAKTRQTSSCSIPTATIPKWYSRHRTESAHVCKENSFFAAASKEESLVQTEDDEICSFDPSYLTYSYSGDFKTLEELHFIQDLGKGEFGQVKLYMYNGTFYAVKQFADRDEWEKESSISLELRSTLNKRDSEYFILGHCAFENSRTLVMDTALCGDLFSHLHEMTFHQIQCHTQSIVQALEILHSKGFMFRDLKPENVLIDRNQQARLCDFGLASKKTRSYTFCGSVEYVAPEMILNRGHTKQVDLWALGVLVHEMLHGVSPFVCDGDTLGTYESIIRGYIHREFNHNNKNSFEFCVSLLDFVPGRRKVIPWHGI